MEFAEFFEQTEPRLVRLCFLTTLDREAAADAAQEALSRAWRDWPRIGTDSSDPTAWTTTVALNLCRNRWRRIASRARLVPRTYSVDRRSDELPDVDLRRALRRLPARQREAVVLHYWADLGVDACATAMGVTPGAVKQHLSRARRRLAAELGEPDLELEVESP